jgi:hypothetical protein
MTEVRNRAFPVLAGLFAVALAGCGRSGYARVSGVITLNGKPYPNCMVQFLPEAGRGNATPGRGSVGHTDENGRFTLKTVDGVVGAAVGKNLVQIRSEYRKDSKGFDYWDPSAKKTVRSNDDPIPMDWNVKSKKEFDVPSGGTDQANFDIVIGKTPRR